MKKLIDVFNTELQESSRITEIIAIIDTNLVIRNCLQFFLRSWKIV